jgi:predicted peptidase
MKISMRLILLAGLLMSTNSFLHAQEPAKGEQTEMKMKRRADLELSYLLYLPKDYSADKAWPLVVFLHGAGERGSNLEQLKVHGLPKLVAQGQDFEFIVVSPQCPEGKWWVGMDAHIIALIEETMEKYNIDKNRIYLTGLSMGGYGTWSITAGYPERFAAVAPICGGGQPYLAQHIKDVPVWAFHGAKDEVVPRKQSQQMVDAVTAAGGSAKLTIYPEAGHDSWTQTYANPEFYTWLLSHSKKKDK